MRRARQRWHAHGVVRYCACRGGRAARHYLSRMTSTLLTEGPLHTPCRILMIGALGTIGRIVPPLANMPSSREGQPS
jgi:hypothetical protein